MLFSRRQAAAALLASSSAAFIPFRTAQAQNLPAGLQPFTAAEVASVPEGVEALPDTSVVASGNPFSRLTAPVYINGQGPFPFIIDTGANISCVSHSLAEKLKLEPSTPAPVHSVVGVRTRPTVMISELTVGDRNRRRVRAPSLPIMDAGLAGVLGVDWLKGQRLELGLKEQVLQITKSKAEFNRANSVVVPARQRWGQLTIVDAEIVDRKVQILIDSGSQISICNPLTFKLIREIDGKNGRAFSPEIVRLETIMGEAFTGEMAYLPFLRLGGLRLANVPVVNADTHVFDVWGVKDKPAVVLGMDLLSEFKRVALDFGAATVRFDI